MEPLNCIGHLISMGEISSNTCIDSQYILTIPSKWFKLELGLENWVEFGLGQKKREAILGGWNSSSKDMDLKTGQRSTILALACVNITVYWETWQWLMDVVVSCKNKTKQKQTKNRDILQRSWLALKLKVAKTQPE